MEVCIFLYAFHTYYFLLHLLFALLRAAVGHIWPNAKQIVNRQYWQLTSRIVVWRPQIRR